MRARSWWYAILLLFVLRPAVAQTCTPATAPQPSPVSGDTLFLDDALPAGAFFQGGTAGNPMWDSTQSAAGTQSLRHMDSGDNYKYEGYVSGLNVPLYFGEKLVFYFLISECRPTREVKVNFTSAGGDMASVYWGESLVGGESNAKNMGALPAAGQWHRVEIPLSDFPQLETRNLWRVTLMSYGGMVWFDGFAKNGTACVTPSAAAPTIPSGETTWIDDSLPAGAFLQTGYATPEWTTAQAASGTKSLYHAWYGAKHYQGWINGLNEPLSIGENLVFYFHINPCAPAPREVKLQWYTTTGDSAGVYWGEALTGGEGGLINKGAVPAAGEWVRVEVPLSQMPALELRTLQRIAMVHHGGQVNFDRFGKSGTACVIPQAAAPTIPAGETVIVDDTLPAGASFQTGYAYPEWSTSQFASGTKSLVHAWYGTKHYESYVNNLSVPMHIGETFVAYFMINPCTPLPREVKFQLWATTGDSGGFYFGEKLTGGENGMVNMGPVPAAGVWHRVEVPLSQMPSLETRTLKRISMVHHGGQVWFDRLAKGGTACIFPTAASVQPPFPSQDFVYVDDVLQWGATIQNGSWGPLQWDTTQAATGTQSLTHGYYGDQKYESFIKDIQMWTSFNEHIFTYVLIDPCAPPREIRFIWYTDSGETRGAYWGEAAMGGEGSMLNMGPLPATGQWVRLEVPTRDLKLEDRVIMRMSLAHQGGKVWFDHIGLGGENWCWPYFGGPVYADAGDTTFIDNALPAGASLQGDYNGPLVWYDWGGLNGRHLKSIYYGDGKYQTTINGLNQPLLAGQNVSVTTHSNSCVPPSEIRVIWQATDGTRGGAWWGTAHFGDETWANMVNMGALPPVDQWTRLEVPINDIGLAGKTLSKIVVSHWDGQVRFDNFSTMCVMPRKSAPSFAAGEQVFIDDALPTGAWFQNGYRTPHVWNTKQSVSGTQSISTNYVGQQHYEGYVKDIDVNLEIGDKLVFYMLLHECNTPRDVKVKFDGPNGEGGVWWGEALTGGENGYVSMGAMPAAGVWHRIEIPASALMLEQRRITRIRLIHHSGQVWFDRFAVLGPNCIANAVPPPVVPAGDTVFVDDSLPAGAFFQNGYWGPHIWDTNSPATGSQSLRFWYYGNGKHYESYIAGLNEQLHFDENMVAYFRVNECAIPREVRFIWYTHDGHSGGAYYGEALMGGESNMVYLGPVPAAGAWHRVQVPTRALTIEQRRLTRISTAHYGGQVWFDHLGKSGTPCIPAVSDPPASIPSSDEVLVDDSLPAGVQFVNGYGLLAFTNEQAASGTLSMRHGYQGERLSDTFIQPLSLQLNSGDKFVIYVRPNECVPAQEIRIRMWNSQGDSGGAYWGAAKVGDEPGLSYRGALPAAGVWTRLEVPVDDMNVDGMTVYRILIGNYDGQVWFDRVAIARAPQPAVITGFSASPSGTTQSAGTSITWTATATGTVLPLEYQFERQTGGVWTVVQSYGTSNTYTWTPATGDAGTHTIRVSVRNGGTLVSFDDTDTLPIEITP